MQRTPPLQATLRPFRRLLTTLWMVATVLAVVSSLAAQDRWYKGQTHFHSYWSDGTHFPEMVTERYRDLGYDFITPSDHNCVQTGERWVQVAGDGARVPAAVFEAYRKHMGEDRIELKEEGGKTYARLRTFDEVAAMYNKPGEFLLIQADEITGKWGTSQVHMNALNVAEVTGPQEGDSVADCLERDAVAVLEQGRRLGRTTFNHANHPGWRHFDIAPEDLAAATSVQAFEVCNATAGSNYYGDDKHPDMEKFWDIINTLRIESGHAPIFGVAADDTHDYHTINTRTSVPGRSFVAVRASALETEALMQAMVAGDFYSSTGVHLTTCDYDPATKTLRVAVQAEEGVNYKIVFRGTRKDYDRTTTTIDDPAHDGWPDRTVTVYSDDMGAVFATVDGAEASYTLSGDEMYVRAIIYSDKPMFSPPAGQMQEEMAWTQPVGWR